MPRVAFILPARNAAATLPEALESIQRQSHRDFEILAFDDGSTDDTLAVLERAAGSDPRVRIVGSERLGLVGALRAAIGASDAELLARMDADDRCHPDRLAKQLEMLDARPELAAVGSAVRCFPAELVAAGMRRYEEWLNSLLTPEQIAGDIFVESPMCHPSVTMRRTAYEAVGGYLDDGCPEDYHLWLRFHAHQLPMAKSPRVLLEWRESADRLTRVDPRYDHDRFFELKERYLLAGPLAERSRITIWGAGRNGRAWGRRLEARGRAIGAYVDVDRRKIGRAIRGVPIIAPEELEPCGSAQYLVAAVGTTGARPRIREFLHQRGLREPDHFVCVA